MWPSNETNWQIFQYNTHNCTWLITNHFIIYEHHTDTVPTVPCSWLSDLQSDVVFCSRRPSASRFDMLCIPRRSSAHHSWVVIWFTLVFLSAQTSFHFHFHFNALLPSLYRLLCVKFPKDQQSLKYSNKPIWHQQSCHGQNHCDSHSDGGWDKYWIG